MVVWVSRLGNYHFILPVVVLALHIHYQSHFDVGTNNPHLLNDPIYMGWSQPRISGDEYYAFVDEVIQAVKRRWPKAFNSV